MLARMELATTRLSKRSWKMRMKTTMTTMAMKTSAKMLTTRTMNNLRTKLILWMKTSKNSTTKWEKLASQLAKNGSPASSCYQTKRHSLKPWRFLKRWRTPKKRSWMRAPFHTVEAGLSLHSLLIMQASVSARQDMPTLAIWIGIRLRPWSKKEFIDCK